MRERGRRRKRLKDVHSKLSDKQGNESKALSDLELIGLNEICAVIQIMSARELSLSQMLLSRLGVFLTIHAPSFDPSSMYLNYLIKRILELKSK